jgi:DNA-directed RNA polymerase subunit M/transcription elongation factor TFIIS
MSSSIINLSSLPAPSRRNTEGAIQSFEALLTKYAEDLHLSKKDLDKLTNLKKNGEYLLTVNNFGFVYEIFGMLKSLGFQETYAFLEKMGLEKGSSKVSSKNILDSQLFEREETLYQAEIARLRDEFQVKLKGLYNCTKCGSQNTIDTISSRQRSSDEAIVYDITCQDCGNSFKRG